MAVIYISPTGSSTNSGSSIAKALSITSLDTAIQLAGAGGTVKLIADRGAYDLTSSIWVSHGGTASAPVTIMGVDSGGIEANIQINGTRPAEYVVGMAAGNEIFKLISGANNLVFENMAFANVGVAFRAGSDISNVVIQDMYADNVQRFFEDYASGTSASATVSDLTIRNVEVHGFSKGVVRLQYDSHDILIENVWGDSERQDGDGIAMGVHLDGTVHDVLIRNATMMNARSSAVDYWNGDGFATEGGVYNVTFENTTATGNADGGYDLKSTGTTLINAVAEDNGRNFRLWGEASLIDPVGIDPHKWGGLTGGQSQIQIMAGAHVTVTDGSFVDSGSATAVVVNNGGAINFSGTSFVYATSGHLKSGSGSSGTLGIDNALVKTVAATGSYSTDGPINAVPAILSATATGGATEWADNSANETSNAPHTVSGSIIYSDANASDLHTASVAAKGTGYLGTLSLNTAAIDSSDTVGWLFSVSDSAIDYLTVGQTKTQAYDITINDGHGGTVTQTVAITLTGAGDSASNSRPVIVSATATGQVTEWADKSANETANTPHTASGSVVYSDANALDVHTASFTPKGKTYLGTFSLNSAAIDSADTVDWSFTVSDSALDSLKAGKSKIQSYDVTVSDGHGGTVTQTIAITLVGTDDSASSTPRAPRQRGNDPNSAQDTDSSGTPPDGGRHHEGLDAAGQGPAPAFHHAAPDLATLLGAHLQLAEHWL